MSKVRTTLYTALVALTGVLLAPAPSALAAPFPAAANNEVTSSLGLFSISVNPAFQSYIAVNVPAGFTYNPTTGVLYSPLLNDPSTALGSSAPTNTSSLPATVTIGTGGSANTVAPPALTYPAGYTPAAGTDVVYTQIQTFDLSNGSTSVTAGSAAAGAPNSYGLVESQQQPTTNSSNDFPAKSFFDVFVDVNITVPGLGPVTLDNTTPLLVENGDVPGPTLPPKVVYTHGNSSSVPLYIVAGPDNGDLFGTIQLAGHGAGFTTSPSDEELFYYEFEEDELLNGTPLTASDYAGFGIPNLIPEPGSLGLCAAGLGALGWLRRRRSRQGA